MTQIDSQPVYLVDEEIRRAREELRTALYKNSVSKRRGFADKVWSWISLPIVVSYVLLGVIEALRPKPLPPKISAVMLFIVAVSFLIIWKQGRVVLSLSRSLALAVDNHLRQLDKVLEERIDRSDKARVATDVRHEANRKRRRDAKAHYWARDWKAQADAARSIADSFNVTEKVAARWVAEWKREGNSASKDGASSNEE